MSFALAPGEVPLGIKKPLLCPPPLGQMMLKPKFMTPLGTRSLLALDHSFLASEFDADPSISFQDSSFFESPNPPQPESQIRRKSTELVLNPIARSVELSSPASIPKSFTEETVEPIDQLEVKFQSSSEFYSEVLPKLDIQTKSQAIISEFIEPEFVEQQSIVSDSLNQENTSQITLQTKVDEPINSTIEPEFVESLSRSDSLVQQVDLVPASPLKKGGSDSDITVFRREKESEPIFEISPTNAESATFIKVPLTNEHLGRSESILTRNELNTESESLESFTETTPIAPLPTIQLNPIQTTEQSITSELSTQFLPIAINPAPPSPLGKRGPESQPEPESQSQLKAEPTPENNIKVPLNNENSEDSKSISITSQSEITPQLPIQLDSLEELSNEIIQAQFIENSIVPEASPEVLSKPAEVTDETLPEVFLDQGSEVRSLVQLQPEFDTSQRIESELFNQNNISKETTIESIQPKLFEPITAIELLIQQEQTDSAIPEIIQPKLQTSEIPQIQQSSKLDSNIQLPTQGIQAIQPIATEQLNPIEKLISDQPIVDTSVVNQPILPTESIQTESIQTESIQAQSLRSPEIINLTESPEIISPSASFPELPRAIQSLSVLEPLAQLKPLSITTIVDPHSTPPNNINSSWEQAQIPLPTPTPIIETTPQFSEQRINRRSDNLEETPNLTINTISESSLPSEIRGESDTSWSNIAELLQTPIETRPAPESISGSVSQSIPQSVQTSPGSYPEPSPEINQSQIPQSDYRYPDRDSNPYIDRYSNLNLYPEANAPPIEPFIQREMMEAPAESIPKSHGPTSPSNTPSSSQPSPPQASPEQLEQLAQEIYRLMRQRLALDRERYGNLYSGRLF